MNEPKRLYKNKAMGKLEGVCAGLAEYFNADPTLIRLLWAIVTVMACGTGIIAYIIAAIVMPDKSDINNNNF